MAFRSNLDAGSGIPVRGVGAGDPVIAPVAQAVVMGLGGSGIQTVSRVKSMVESGFPEAIATSSLSFLGIDAVRLDKQNPPLPTGVSLPANDFYNLTETIFDAAKIVAAESQYDSALQNWWDYSRRVPAGAQEDGLKQDRMLGRLAYYRRGEDLEQRIAHAMRSSARITSDRVEAGQGGGGAGGARPRVYMVASMCGGTGSSGVLEALYRVWSAANGIGLAPEIRLFLYMPGIFEGEAARNSVDPPAQIANLRANAYGFLRELDHFVTHSDQLRKHIANPGRGPVAEIPAGDLVKQVFLLDSQLSSGQFLGQITDAYEVAASAIYQLLMTRAGQEIAINGTNMDQLLQDVDGHGKRRIYCGLGLASITYPGETLRRHLSHRFADWIVSELLLDRPADLGEQVRRDQETENLLGQLSGLHSSAVSFERADIVNRYNRLCVSAPETLAADNTDETVSRVVTTAKLTRPRAVSELRRQLEVYSQMALQQLEPKIVDHLLSTGRAVPFLAQMLKHVSAQLVKLRADAESLVSRHQDTLRRGEEEIDAANRVLAEKVGFRAWLGRRDTAAKDLGQAILAFGQATIELQLAQGSADFYSAAIESVSRLQSELESAERVLLEEAHRLSAVWHADELVGKDAGPRNLTALIPADVQPEVEDSEFAREAYKRVQKAAAILDRTELMSTLYREWRGEARGRAPFDLGATSNDLVTTSKGALLRHLEQLADTHALQVGVPEETPEGDSNRHLIYLPRSLEEAAARMDDGVSLDTALVSTGALAGHVLMPVDTNKLRSSGLSPSTLVSRPASLAGRVARQLPDTQGRQSHDWPDEERIQVLTTVWGASAHSLTAVPTWKQHYENALESDRLGLRRPPHLSRTWLDDLDPLEPTYNDLELAADAVVQALLSGKLLKVDAVHEVIFGQYSTRDQVGRPLTAKDLGMRTAWNGMTFVQDGKTRRWRARPQQFDFGATWGELLEAVSANAPYRQFSIEFTESVLEQAGRATALQTLRDLSDQFENLAPKNEHDPEEKKAVQLLLHSVRQLSETMDRVGATPGL